MLEPDDIEVTSGSDKDIHLINNRFQGHHLEAFHAGLEGTDGIDLSNQDASTGATHSEGRALAHVAIAAHEDPLTTNHHVSCAHYSIRQRVAATIDVVELGLGHAVVDVDSGEQELPLGSHLLEPVHASGCLLRDPFAL